MTKYDVYLLIVHSPPSSSTRIIGVFSDESEARHAMKTLLETHELDGEQFGANIDAFLMVRPFHDHRR